MIQTALLERLVWDSVDSQRKVYPCHTNRASNIGHPCLRYLVFERTRWQDKLLPEVELQFIFNEGSVQEQAVMETLTKAGFKLSQQQRAYFEGPQKLSGHLDTNIAHEEYIPKPIPAEIKGLSQHNWESITTYEDMLKHKQWYVRKYPAQLQIYMYMSECPQGLFILKNKQNGRLKFILADLDFEYVEGLLKKAETVNKMVDSGQIPEAYDGIDVCQRCEFRHICFKDRTFGNGIIALNDDQLAGRIRKMQSLEDVAAECKDLKEEVGEQLKCRADKDCSGQDRAQFIVNDYVVTLSRVKPKDKNPYWKIAEIEKV